MKPLLLALSMLLSLYANAQTLRGTVTDAFTGAPLDGAVVMVVELNTPLSTVTKEDGSFSIGRLPLGRKTIRVSMMGYHTSEVPNLMLASGKETVVNLKLVEKVTQLNEVVVSNRPQRDKTLNEMATLSARSFSVEQTERFAGSLGDPARMVANYAGVMAGNDSRNDIVIRGNSPLGVQWRIDGVEIPNPNHFGAQGTTGGSVSMLNSNLLSSSDFLTGAFPAEYGNVTSGVFDLNMRSGNNSKYEFTGQVGFNGFEAAAEGPFKLGKNGPKGSFLVDYRYSTLDLMQKMGMDMGTGMAVPEYQDLTMSVDLPTLKAGRFKMIALLGKSMIRLGRDFDTSTGVAHSDFGTATDFGANLAFVAFTHRYFFSENTSLNSSISYNFNSSSTVFDTVDYANKTYFTAYQGILGEATHSATTQLKHRISNRDFLTAGIDLNIYRTAFSDSAWVREFDRTISVRQVNDRYSQLFKTYVGYQHKFSDNLLLNTGLHYQYYSLSKEGTLEPRISVNWQLGQGQEFNLGYGLHSQIQTRITYYNQTYHALSNTYSENNHDLKSTKAHHFVLGYGKRFDSNIRIKAEAYLQELYDVPVSSSSPQFSMLNQGSEYHFTLQDSLSNTGKGRNYGVELTLEKMLDNGYYFLLTASLFDSKYQGYDKVWRNTAYNTQYVFNALGGYEWRLGKNNFLTFDLKTVWSGGRRTSPIDLAASMRESYTVYDETHAFEDSFKDYFRTDLRIGFRTNGKKITQEWALDLQNVTNHQNIYSETYNPYSKQLALTYQQGFMPMMLYRINF